MTTMNNFLKKFANFAANRRLKQALEYVQRGSSYRNESAWITPELLEEHEMFPYHLAPNGSRTYVMNLRNPEDIDFWSIGKHLQRKHDIEFECVAEVQAGFWAFLRQEVLLTPIE